MKECMTLPDFKRRARRTIWGILLLLVSTFVAFILIASGVFKPQVEDPTQAPKYFTEGNWIQNTYNIIGTILIFAGMVASLAIGAWLIQDAWKEDFK